MVTSNMPLFIIIIASNAVITNGQVSFTVLF